MIRLGAGLEENIQKKGKTMRQEPPDRTRPREATREKKKNKEALWGG